MKQEPEYIYMLNLTPDQVNALFANPPKDLIIDRLEGDKWGIKKCSRSKADLLKLIDSQQVSLQSSPQRYGTGRSPLGWRNGARSSQGKNCSFGFSGRKY